MVTRKTKNGDEQRQAPEPMEIDPSTKLRQRNTNFKPKGSNEHVQKRSNKYEIVIEIEENTEALCDNDSLPF